MWSYYVHHPTCYTLPEVNSVIALKYSLFALSYNKTMIIEHNMIMYKTNHEHVNNSLSHYHTGHEYAMKI